MRSIILALAAFAFVTTASAATGGPPYKLDAKGKCHDSSGKFTKQSNCTAPATPKHCRETLG